MPELEKLKFHALELSGKNYITWVTDLKIHLQARNLHDTVKEENSTSTQQKSQAMEIIRHHIHESLKAEYLTMEDPLILWNALKERYEHRKEVDLPKARYDWIHLRLQDFKSVSDYNSELHRITAILESCGEKISDEDKIEKTFSTFHADRLLLQKQYRERGFKKYGELISCLMISEQNDQVLIKNHELRPVGTFAPPEINANTYGGGGNNNNRGRGYSHNRGCGQGRGPGHNHGYGRGNNNNNGRGRGRGRGRGSGRRQDRGRGRGQNRYNPYNQGNLVWTRDASQSQNRDVNYRNKRSVCYRCGSTEHFLRQCRTPKHLVDLYQASQQEKMKSVETNVTNLASGEGTSQGNATNFYTSDFFDDVDGEIERLIKSSEEEKMV